MSDRRVRSAFVALILAFPVLMALPVLRRGMTHEAMPAVAAAEAVLLVGLASAVTRNGLARR
jgi:hypothetical protein